MASSLIAHVPRNDRGRWNSATSDSAWINLKTDVAAWYGARSLSRDAFRMQFLDPYTSDDIVDHLRSAAKGMVEGETHDDLAKAGDDLAAAAQKIGPDTWPRFLGNASHQAVEAVSRGDVPGVIRASASDAPVSAFVAFLGLLAIIIGLSQPGNPPSTSRSTPISPSLPTVVQAVPLPPPEEGETPADVLKPGGQNVGKRGDSSGVRVLPGGEQGARELFDRLTNNKGGEDITPAGHVGQVISLPDGSIIGFRPTSNSGPPTVDITISGLSVRKLKFPWEDPVKTLTDEQQRFLVDEFSADPEDPEGLFAIAHAVEHLGVDPDAVREQTLLIVEQLLSKGMAAGNSPYHSGGYQPWPNQDRSAVLHRIRSEWIALGRSPNIPEIAWFGPAKQA